MKLLYTLLFFVFIQSLIGQQYQKLIEPNKHWIIIESDPKLITGTAAKYMLSTGHDTIIGKNSYTLINVRGFLPAELENSPLIFTSELSENSLPIAAMREDTINRKVYSRFLQGDFTDEFLAYDFNLQVMDTFCVPFQNSYPECFILESIESYEFENGELSSKYNFYSPHSIREHFIIEGVGGDSGLISPIFPVFEYAYSLICTSHFDEIQSGEFFDPEEVLFGFCNTFTSYTSEIEGQNIKLEFYPNPTMGNISISSNGLAIKQIELYNSSLKILKTFDANTSEIDLESFNSGLYFIKVLFNENSSYTSKVVKI